MHPVCASGAQGLIVRCAPVLARAHSRSNLAQATYSEPVLSPERCDAGGAVDVEAVAGAAGIDIGRAGLGPRGERVEVDVEHAGLAYSVDYVAEEVAMDEKIETPGGIFYIDGASVLYLVGSIMDWVEDDFSAGFVFENPNAKGACGCGESFMV